VGEESDWAVVATGYFHSLALKADGGLWAWGWNSYSQLGDGTDASRNVPTFVGGGWRVPAE
jgi:alpha-tubulin suppressor-like RCC1 family protein